MRDIDLGDPNLNLKALDDGSIVCERVFNLIQTITDTWQGRLEVRWIPQRALKEGDNQFLIVELLPDGREYPVMWIKDESEFTGEVLERLYLADNTKGNVLTRMQARNAAVRALQKTLVEDEMAQKKDIMVHALRSPKNWYKLPKDVGGAVIKDYGNRTK